MKILYVATEATPFVASGGLGDVMGALPAAIRRLGGRGLEVGVILPLYRAVKAAYKAELSPVYTGTLTLAWRCIPYTVHSHSKDGVTYYFVENPRYFDRPALYGEYDDGERFAFFCRAVIDFILMSDRVPDILHANDWQSALSVIYPRTVYRAEERLSSLRTVFTIHNIAYQGRYDSAILSDVLDIHPVHRHLLMHRGCLSLMAGAIRLADRVTTVSPRYAEEICREPLGEGLSELFCAEGKRPFGILNGLDLAYFSPKDGDALSWPYTPSSVQEGKAACKRAALRELALPLGDAPLLLMVTRLAEPKGLDLVLSILPRLLSQKLRFVLLGTGDRYYEDAFAALAESYENMRFLRRFDRELSKKLYAAADLFLMPSRTEPCGLAQMIACRYGTVPIVRATGGLYDSIPPYGREGGIGFLFEQYSADALYEAVMAALSLYRSCPLEFDRLRRAAMQADFGWHRSAGAYLALYRALLEE